MSGWVTKTIGEVCELVNGGTPKTGTAEFWGGKHHWVTPAEMGKRASPYIDTTERTLTDAGLANCSARPLPVNSVILSSRAPIGHLVINTVPMSFNQGCKGLIPKPSLHHKFLYYFLLANVDLLNSLGTGATFRELSGGKLKEVALPVPSLPEQKRIVAILDEAFEGIAKATANAERNLANARELIAGSCHALVSNVAPDAERVSLEALLERGWIVSHLDGNHGSDYPRKEEFVPQGVPYISANAIDDDTVDMGAAKYLAPERAARIRKGVAQNGDVLFAHNATVGPVAILETAEPKVILGTSLTYYRCRADVIDNRYLAHYMRSRLFTSQYDQVMRQSTRNQVPITKQREFFHVIPPLEAQREISHRLDAFDEWSRCLRRLYTEKTDRCIKLRHSLLHKAFSGQLTGKEVIAA